MKTLEIERIMIDENHNVVQARMNVRDYDNSNIFILTKSELKEALLNVELWQYSHRDTNFGYKLVELIAKADEYNKARFLLSFPEYVIAYLLWFYKKWNDTKFNNDEEFFECMKAKLAKSE